MSEEQQGRLFQNFTQAEASTASSYGGTGHGLAHSREFARLPGGEITVASPDIFLSHQGVSVAAMKRRAL